MPTTANPARTIVASGVGDCPGVVIDQYLRLSQAQPPLRVTDPPGHGTVSLRQGGRREPREKQPGGQDCEANPHGSPKRYRSPSRLTVVSAEPSGRSVMMIGYPSATRLPPEGAIRGRRKSPGPASAASVPSGRVTT